MKSFFAYPARDHDMSDHEIDSSQNRHEGITVDLLWLLSLLPIVVTLNTAPWLRNRSSSPQLASSHRRTINAPCCCCRRRRRCCCCCRCRCCCVLPQTIGVSDMFCSACLCALNECSPGKQGWDCRMVRVLHGRSSTMPCMIPPGCQRRAETAAAL